MIIVAALTLTTTIGCKKTATTTYDCTSVTPTYATDIKPIMDVSCASAGCHSASAKAQGIDLSSYAAVKLESSNKAFMGSMQHSRGYSSMPKNASKLTDASLQKIYCWIQNSTPQ